MSVEQVNAFVERMKSDEAFREKIMTLQDLAEQLQLVKEQGYDLSAEGLKKAWVELQSAAMEESRDLDDEQLGSVSGGWFFIKEDYDRNS